MPRGRADKIYATVRANARQPAIALPSAGDVDSAKPFSWSGLPRPPHEIDIVEKSEEICTEEEQHLVGLDALDRGVGRTGDQESDSTGDQER
jgi:hypothetical protein